MTSDPAAEEDLIAAAQRGDQQAYGQLVAAYSAELRAHCYRMLGSPADAEDAVQEALMRAWRGMPGFERRGSLRRWLYTIATNSCLKIIERRPPRALSTDYGPAADPQRADPVATDQVTGGPGQRSGARRAALRDEPRGSPHCAAALCTFGVQSIGQVVSAQFVSYSRRVSAGSGWAGRLLGWGGSVGGRRRIAKR